MFAKKAFKNEGLAVICSKNIIFCNVCFKLNHVSVVFHIFFENRRNSGDAICIYNDMTIR